MKQINKIIFIIIIALGFSTISKASEFSKTIGASGNTSKTTYPSYAGVFGLKNTYLDASLFAGYSKISYSDSYEAPTLGQGGGSITAGYWLRDYINFDLFVGATTDFRFINQYSDVDPIIGNKRGYRWNTVAPEIGVKYWRLLLKGNFQFLGSYNILNKTDEDITIKYKSPLGGKLTALYPLAAEISPWKFLNNIHLGVHVEYLAFSDLETSYDNVVSGTTELPSAQKIWQAGISATYVF